MINGCIGGKNAPFFSSNIVNVLEDDIMSIESGKFTYRINVKKLSVLRFQILIESKRT